MGTIMIPRAIKIIATIGPASAEPSRLVSLMKEGVDLFRFNFAHETREVHAERIALVQKLAADLGLPVGTLADISGPKIRLGKLPGDAANLEVGQSVTLCSPEGDGEGWPVQLPEFNTYVQPGDPIYLADGTRKLTVTATKAGVVQATVEIGGMVGSFKGINLPHLRRPLPTVGTKDLLDAEAALRAGIDWIGLSFVSEPNDLHPIHDLMKRLNLRRPVIAKLERRQALDKLDSIVEAFDGVMVARGDLGIEVEFEKVPLIQERILRTARRFGKPAIVATQILTSMVNSPRPTRAEATDIAYAILGGADALMLSEETAVGQYPEESVRAIIKVAHEVEAVYSREVELPAGTLKDALAVAHTATVLARDTAAAAILCATHSGNAARAVARFRPGVPIIVVSDDRHTVGELLLYGGVHPRLAPLSPSLEARIKASLQAASQMGLATPGDKLVVVGGVPAGSGNTNLLLVYTVPKIATTNET